MAKKTSKKKPAPKAKPARAARAKKPKDQPLPGMEVAKIPALSRVCGEIAEIREQKNELVTDERKALAKALGIMKEHGIESYTSARVELYRTSTEKLRVRLVDDDNADTDPEQGDLGDVEPTGDDLEA